MILVLSIWVLIFFVFFTLGFILCRVLEKTPCFKDQAGSLGPDGYFFMGFLSLSLVVGILSIFIPIDSKVLLSVLFLFAILLIINFKKLITELKQSLKSISDLSTLEQLILSFLIVFILTAVVQDITWLDTQSYHAQNIQWIRKYAVVPGLGNLHDRFAFNSMFFVISALFTFQLEDVLIFPLNGICYIILIVRLLFLYNQASKNRFYWKSIFYASLLLVSLLVMISNLNTPSPDIICATLILYTFIRIIDQTTVVHNLPGILFLLVNLLIFTCLSYKLSSLFLVFLNYLFFNKKLLKRSILTLAIFLLIILPFVVRNYFLSGYLIYPFPAIDIFNVDWKIPIKNVIETKSVIEGWARIPVIPYIEVLKMRFTEWIPLWFSQLSFFSKLLVIGNFLSITSFFIMLFRKNYFLAKIHFIILINLFFWFFQAPDPRFAYGFIFLGFSLAVAYFSKLFQKSALFSNRKLIDAVFLCVLFIIFYRRFSLPEQTVRTAALYLMPAPFEIVETKEYSTNFTYRIPVDKKECFNSDIPCVTCILNDVYLRGIDFQDGFKVLKMNK